MKGKRGDPRSDIYSLGVMLYDVDRQPPFRGANPFAIMNNRIVNHQIPPREADPGISRQLEEVIYRALEPDDQKRYATAAEFAFDLEHLENVAVSERVEIRNWKHRQSPAPCKWRTTGLFAVLPIAVLLFMLVTRYR